MATTNVDTGFISVAVIYGADGYDDEVWVSVLRKGEATAFGPYCSIERLNPVDWETANVGQPQLADIVYCDCATTITGPGSNIIAGIPQQLANRPLVASIVPASGTGAWAIRNLVASGTYTPSFGTVTCTIPNYSPASGDTVTIGLPINWYVEPMRLDLDPQQGPTPGRT